MNCPVMAVADMRVTAKLGGKKALMALNDIKAKLCFPKGDKAPANSLPKPGICDICEEGANGRLRPGSLRAAYYLTRLGHSVTVFEAGSKPGGMMRTAIPRFVLPQEVLDEDIDEILRLGIELKTK